MNWTFCCYSLAHSFRAKHIQIDTCKMWNHLPLQLIVIIAALWEPTIAEVCIFGENVENTPSVLGTGVFMVMSHKAIVCDGKVSEWEFWAERLGKFRAMILRPYVGQDNNTFTIIGINDIDTDGMVNRKASFMVPNNDQIDVKEGDMIAVATYSENDPRLQLVPGVDSRATFVNPTTLSLHGTIVTSIIVHATLAMSVSISVTSVTTDLPATKLNSDAMSWMNEKTTSLITAVIPTDLPTKTLQSDAIPRMNEKITYSFIGIIIGASIGSSILTVLLIFFNVYIFKRSRYGQEEQRQTETNVITNQAYEHPQHGALYTDLDSSQQQTSEYKDLTNPGALKTTDNYLIPTVTSRQGEHEYQDVITNQDINEYMEVI